MIVSMDLNTILSHLRKSELIESSLLESLLTSGELPDDPSRMLESLITKGLLTRFQVRLLQQGKYRGFWLGPYKILRPLGKGGMSLVYLAEHSRMSRQVAIKIVRTDRLGAGVLERFAREGRVAAALSHPNIITVFDFGCEGDCHYLVMEYIKGKTLQDMIDEQGALSVRQAVDYILQAARGLKHAHDQGLVHRDIKPGNLLVDNEGTLKILDMGLSRFVEDKEDNLTERFGGGAILGSPDFIAPEQAMRMLDSRSDIYSLGATFYAALIGEPPYQAPTITQKLMAHQVRPLIPPHLRDTRIPVEISQIVGRMMEKNPDKRFQTPDEIVSSLSTWIEKDLQRTKQIAKADTSSNLSGDQLKSRGIFFPLFLSVLVFLTLAAAIWAWVFNYFS